jgi:DNA-binding GntR family transcriptional regulator
LKHLGFLCILHTVTNVSATEGSSQVDNNPLADIFVHHVQRFAKAPKYREAVYRAIKEAILAGKLAPNQPLIEEQLAASLNISRTPVREALAILQHERFIAARGSRGLFVHRLSRAEFVEMFMANEVIEPYLARRAALLALEDQLRTIGDAIEQAQKAAAAGNMAGFLRASRDFHRAVGEAAGNAILTDFVIANEERADMYLLHAGKSVDAERMEASIREHEAIFEALARRDPEAAERCVIYHAQSLRERLAELFTHQPEENPDE